jgi:hypothetical protein
MNAKKIDLRRQLRIKMLDQMPLCERCQSVYATDLHEVKTRARGGSILDEENIRVLCRPCHSWVTTNPAQATADGWLKNSWEWVRRHAERGSTNVPPRNCVTVPSAELTTKYNVGRTNKLAKPPFEGVSFAGYLPAKLKNS